MRIGRGKRETWREREGGFPLFSLRLLFLVSASLLGWRRRRPSPAAEEDQHSPPLIHRPLGQKLWQGKKRKRERERSAVIPPLVRPSPFPPKSPSFPPLSRAEAPPRFGLMGLGEGEGRRTKVEKWEENGRSLSLIQRRRCFRRFRRRRRRRRGSFVRSTEREKESRCDKLELKWRKKGLEGGGRETASDKKRHTLFLSCCCISAPLVLVTAVAILLATPNATQVQYSVRKRLSRPTHTLAQGTHVFRGYLLSPFFSGDGRTLTQTKILRQNGGGREVGSGSLARLAFRPHEPAQCEFPFSVEFHPTTPLKKLPHPTALRIPSNHAHFFFFLQIRARPSARQSVASQHSADESGET